MEKNYTFVVFGATGDLMKRKLVPAFLSLFKKKVIGKNSLIVAVGRREFDNKQYLEFLSSGNTKKDEILNLPLIYFKGDISKKLGLQGLASFLTKHESEKRERIFYLSTSYEFFENIISEINFEKLKEGAKIIFEKPFGKDKQSFLELEENILSNFNENQIYRIDHYLAKDTVQNLVFLKYFNPFFEGLLDSKFVESIEVIVDENLNVGERLSYYHDSGAVRDMIQNHLLQVLAILIMDVNDKMDTSFIHEAKRKALANLIFDLSENNILGQYSSYKDEVVKTGLEYKKTETFCKLFFKSKSPRWKRTKFILQTGKKLNKKEGRIIINFRKQKFEKTAGNKIIVDIYPKQDINLFINSRTPQDTLTEVKLEFSHEKNFGPNSSDEYSVLLEEVIHSKNILFTKHSELNECWRIVDFIQKNRDKIKFIIYPDGWDTKN